MGRCRQIRESFPLGPVIEAVRGVAAEVSGLRLSPVAGALLPELAGVLPPGLEPLDDRAAQRHGVFRGQAVYEHLSGPRRQDLHARAGTVLASHDPVPLGQVAIISSRPGGAPNGRRPPSAPLTRPRNWPTTRR